MKEEDKLDDFFCCLNVEATTTICLVITLCMLTCCSVFVPDELFPFVIIVVVLLAVTTPAAILLKSPQMLLLFILVTIHGQCIQGSRQLQHAQISANKRIMVTPSAPPMCAINASRPQPNLFVIH
uniref:Transmembrane protein n=1 Tax=Ascaris lumbricoides TaxID=6252 RepID=A0A0M3IGY6_ASCLU